MEIRFRDLTVDNLFDCCAAIDAIGVEQVIGAFDKDEIRALSAAGKDSRGIGIVIGMKICGIVIKNLPKAREEIYTFIANCMIWDNETAVMVDEVRKMKIGQFVKLLKEFFKKEDLTDFFREVAGFAGLDQSGSESLSGDDTETPKVI